MIEVPAARVRQIKASTKRLLALVRTFVKDPKDLKAAQKLHTSFTHRAGIQVPQGTDQVAGRPRRHGAERFAPIDLTGSNNSLYQEINSLINEYPPLPADAKRAKPLRSVGVDVKHYRQPSATLAPVLQAGDRSDPGLPPDRADPRRRMGCEPSRPEHHPRSTRWPAPPRSTGAFPNRRIPADPPHLHPETGDLQRRLEAAPAPTDRITALQVFPSDKRTRRSVTIPA